MHHHFFSNFKSLKSFVYLYTLLILAKALAKRIWLLVAKIIHKEQTGFIKGEINLDNLITAWEGLEWAQESEQKALLLKIDFDKAYDTLHPQHVELVGIWLYVSLIGSDTLLTGFCMYSVKFEQCSFDNYCIATLHQKGVSIGAISLCHCH
jgi:hypothetical protein